MRSTRGVSIVLYHFPAADRHIIAFVVPPFFSILYYDRCELVPKDLKGQICGHGGFRLYIQLQQCGDTASTAAYHENKMCDGCGLIYGKLKKCARCEQVHYCAAECQRAHWKEHKSTCASHQAPVCCERRSSNGAAINWNPSLPAEKKSKVVVEFGTQKNKWVLKSEKKTHCGPVD